MLHADLMSRISAAELRRWRILEQIEPFGERAEYFRAGLICAVLVNGNPYRSKDAKTVTASDFMPQFDAPVAQAAEEQRSILMMFQEAQDSYVRSKADT